MCPETMVSCCNAQASCEVVSNGPNGSLEVQRSPVSTDETDHRNADNEDDIQPVDVLIPICFGDGLICNVWLLGIVLRIAVGF